MLAVLRHRDFALLWVAGLVSLAGDWMLLIALPIHVYRLTDSALATSIVLIANRLPAVLLGSLAGVFVDRWDRKRTMVAADLVRAGVLLPLLTVRDARHLWVVVAVAFTAAAVGQFFGPAEHALLPRLVPPARLLPANSLNALNNSLAGLVGPPVGGLVLAAWGLGGVAVLDAATFLVAGALIAAIGQSGRPERAAPGAAPRPVRRWGAVWEEWRSGVRLAGRDRVVAVAFVLEAIAGIGGGVFGVLVVVFVAEVLGGGAPELGWLLAAQAVGGLIGGAVVGAVGGKLPLPRLVGLGAIGIGVVDLAIFTYPALVPGIAPGLALFVVIGIPAVGFGTGRTTLVQLRVADAFRGRVFGALGATYALLNVAGAALAGALGERLGIVPMLSVVSTAFILAGLAAMVLLRGDPMGPPHRDPRPVPITPPSPSARRVPHPDADADEPPRG